MKISRAAEGFLLFMASNNYSHNTANIYRIHLKQMQDFLGDLELEDLTPETVQRFYVWYSTEYRPHMFGEEKKAEKAASGTLYNCWCMLRTFSKWLTQTLKMPRIDGLI